MKEFVKKVLKSSKFGSLIYEPLHKLYRLYSVPARRRVLKRVGKAVLADLVRIVDKHGIPAFPCCGTLLGFIRDGGFMPHDDDMDWSVIPGEWTPVRVLKTLLDEGFEYVFGFVYDGKLIEFNLRYKGLPIDFIMYDDDGKYFNEHVFYYVPGTNYPSPNANTVKVFPNMRFFELTRREIYGIQVPVPKDAEAVCADHYGPKWNIPDAKYKGDANSKLIDMPNYGYSVTLEEALRSK